MFNATQSQKKLVDGVQFPPAGKYVVAVSGGVDSVSLLDILASHSKDLDLAVAHFDHGWVDHPETEARQAVAALCKVLGLTLYTGDAGNTPMSEEQGRRSRYDYLFGLAAALGANGVITAHHGDDRVETSFFNVSRGTSRRGRAADLDRSGIWRPLLNVGKSELQDYAAQRGLPIWQDSADADLRFSRNFIRQEILPNAEQQNPGFYWLYRQLMLNSEIISSQVENRLNKLFAQVSSRSFRSIELDRIELQHRSIPVIAEVLAHTVRQLEPGLQLSRERLKQLALAVKMARTGVQKDIAGRLKLRVGYDRVAVVLPQKSTAANLEILTPEAQSQ